MNRTEKQKMMAGHLYDAGDAEIEADREATHRRLERYNAALAMPARSVSVLCFESAASRIETASVGIESVYPRTRNT
jgi:maltose O-acetyltransferase